MRAFLKPAFVLLVGTFITLSLSALVAGQEGTGEPDYRVIFEVPVGPEGIGLEGISSEESPWGPNSLKIDAAGTFWIADAVHKRLLRYSENGDLIQILTAPEALVSIRDFALYADGAYLLDTSSQEPAVYDVTFKGEVRGSWSIDAELIPSITGLYESRNAGVLLEVEGGSSYLARARKTGEWTSYNLLGEQGLSVQSHAHSVTLVAPGEKEEFFVNATLGRVNLLDSGSANALAFLTEEVDASSGTILVDQVVVRSREGSFERARVPLKEQLASVEHPVAVAGNGDVYALVTGSTSIKVVRLTFRPELVGILPGTNEASLSFEGLCATSCIERSTMMSTARSYYNNSKYLSSVNIAPTGCIGRGMPHYLTTAKTYRSVPYDWGGFDSLSGFNAAMSASSNNKAGDIDTTSVENCSRGVDCSGYVSRIWGRSSKVGTSGLPDISYQLSSTTVLQAGDIVNKVDDHTALFDRATSNGAFWYESTKYEAVDRVVYNFRDWSRFKNFKPLRYRNVCGGTCQ